MGNGKEGVIMEDVLQQLRSAGYEPEVQEDKSDFEPVKGKYICRIDSAGRVQGTSERTGKDYDFRSIKVQVAEIVSGDKATNRFLDLIYRPDIDGMKKLLNDLFTAGIETKASSEVELDEFLDTLKDKTLNIRAWVSPRQIFDKETEKWVVVEPRTDIQRLKVVKDFAKGKKKPDSIKSNIPF